MDEERPYIILPVAQIRQALEKSIKALEKEDADYEKQFQQELAKFRKEHFKTLSQLELLYQEILVDFTRRYPNVKSVELANFTVTTIFTVKLVPWNILLKIGRPPYQDLVTTAVQIFPGWPDPHSYFRVREKLLPPLPVRHNNYLLRHAKNLLSTVRKNGVQKVSLHTADRFKIPYDPNTIQGDKAL